MPQSVARKPQELCSHGSGFRPFSERLEQSLALDVAKLVPEGGGRRPRLRTRAVRPSIWLVMTDRRRTGGPLRDVASSGVAEASGGEQGGFGSRIKACVAASVFGARAG